MPACDNPAVQQCRCCGLSWCSYQLVYLDPARWEGHIRDGLCDACRGEHYAIVSKVKESLAFATVESAIQRERERRAPPLFTRRRIGELLNRRLDILRQAEDEFRSQPCKHMTENGFRLNTAGASGAPVFVAWAAP
jgi:hypothetical protein